MRIAIAADLARRAGDAEQYLATLVSPLLRSGHAVVCWFGTKGSHQPVIFDHADAVESWRAPDDARGPFDSLPAGARTAATRFRMPGHMAAAGVSAEAVPA